MSPYADTPTIPEGQTCAEYRYRLAAPKVSAWRHIAARVLAVAFYEMGAISAYRRDSL